MKKLTGYFLKGLLFTAPFGLTAYVLWFAFSRIDGLLGLRVPGLGLLLLVAGVTLVGFLASAVLGNWLLAQAEDLLLRLPMVKLVYTSLKDLLEAFVGKKRMFERPVLVTVGPDPSVRVFGFVTREDLADLGAAGHVAVYVPQSYNFAGNLLVVPRDRVTPVPKEGPEVMALVVSAGVSGT